LAFVWLLEPLGAKRFLELTGLFFKLLSMDIGAFQSLLHHPSHEIRRTLINPFFATRDWQPASTVNTTGFATQAARFGRSLMSISQLLPDLLRFAARERRTGALLPGRPQARRDHKQAGFSS